MPHVGNFPERGYPKPLSIGPPEFMPQTEAVEFDITNEHLNNHTALGEQVFWAHVKLPHHANVTKLTLYGYKDAAGGFVQLTLLRFDRQFTSTVMAACSITGETGYQSVSDDTIDVPEVDNENYDYGLRLNIDPDADVGDNYFTGSKIDWN